jgi:ATP-dependent DNA ligase
VILKYALTEVNSQYVVSLGFDPEWIMCFHSAPLHSSLEKSFNKYSLIQESGKDSQDKKRNHMKGLLVAATDCEPQYITRLLQVNHGMFTKCTSFVSCLFMLA